MAGALEPAYLKPLGGKSNSNERMDSAERTLEKQPSKLALANKAELNKFMKFVMKKTPSLNPNDYPLQQPIVDF